jgi:hypothetical protein
LSDLQQEARAAFDRAAVFIRALVGAVLEKLIGQIAVRTVNLDTIEARPQRPLGARPELLDDCWKISSSLRARGIEKGASPRLVYA